MFSRHIGFVLMMAVLQAQASELKTVPTVTPPLLAVTQVQTASVARDSDEQLMSMPAMMTGAWQSLDGDHAVKAYLKMAMAVMPWEMKLLADIRQIRSLPLPFYQDAFLLEARGLDADGRPFTLNVVAHPKGGMTLDGTSPPIHELNAVLPVRLDTEEQAKAYLRFFTSGIQAELGPFIIVEKTSDLWWKSDCDTTESRAMLGLKLRPLEITKAPQGGWNAESTMVYSNVLFNTTMRVAATGVVEMNEDLPLQTDLPIRRIKNKEAARMEHCPGKSCEHKPDAASVADGVAWAGVQTELKHHVQSIENKDFKQAAFHHSRLLAEVEAQLGDSYPGLSEKFVWLGRQHKKNGDIADALTTFERALSIYRKTHAQDDETVAKILNHLAQTHVEAKQYDRAETLLKQALAIHESTLGPDHSGVAECLDALVNLYETQGKPEAAQSLRQRAEAIRNKNEE